MDFPDVFVRCVLLHVRNDQHVGQGKRKENEKVGKYGTKRKEEGELNRLGSTGGHDPLDGIHWA